MPKFACWLAVCFVGALATIAARPNATGSGQQQLRVAGLKEPVEVIRDRWGVPHIYAQNSDDLFFAQGYTTAQDRLFQIDLWRRIGTGKLAEVLGPKYVARDRIARLVRYRGDWDQEWLSYSPDAKAIATAFTNGINAYIRGLHGQRPMEFQIAGFDPGLWAPEDVTARVAGLLMTGNMLAEVNRTLDVEKLGLAADARLFPPEPHVPLLLPKGLDMADITPAVVKDYLAAIGAIHFPGEQGSNNWVVDGTMTRTGKPILANDPHRAIELPSLRKTVHLVAPGWDVIGAGEPALPGIALGHNENIAWGFTIVGIDQQDLYVEKVNPADTSEYLYRGAWKKFDCEQQSLDVKGEGRRTIELKYTVHGPVIYEDDSRRRAYALKWVGTTAGGAGYLPALKLARATNWAEFRSAVASYKIPSENLVYADRQGNIGWIAAGQAPIRQGWTGLFPVPGDSGEYEWSGFLPVTENPTTYNPARHFVATANNDILPAGYPHQLSYTWAPPTRYERIVEMLKSDKKFDVADFARMQQDTVSLPARGFLALLRDWRPEEGSEAAQMRSEMLAWNCDVSMNSQAALLYEVWIEHLHAAILPKGIASVRLAPDILLQQLKALPDRDALLESTLESSLAEIRERLGPDPAKWIWGNLHQVHFQHPLGIASLNLPAHARPGDAYTVNATSGPHYLQTAGASYREIIDVSDWDRSVMTNVPGESGVPGDRHYGDLIDSWADGRYHPMPYSRKAVEAAAETRVLLLPLQSQEVATAQSPLPLAPGASVVTVSPGGGHYSEPGIAVNPKNPNQVVVVFQGGTAVQGSANVAYSNDAGRTFTIAPNTQSREWKVGGDVSTAFDDKGNAYLCYMVFDRLGTTSYWAHDAGRNGILVVRSSDGGKTWEDHAIAVKEYAKGTEPDLQFEDEPRIFADTNPRSPYAGTLYVGWVEWQLTQSVMFFSRSKDGGRTWSPPMRVSAHAGLPRDDNGSLGGFVLASAPDGTIYALWDDDNSIVMTESHDGGASFSPSHRIFDVGPPYFGDVPGVSRVEGFPQIALDPHSGALYVCWSDYRNGDVDVFVASSKDKGRTWSEPIRVNNDPIHNGKDQFYQWLTVDPKDGAVYVQFYDRREDPKNMLASFTLARSTDGARSFQNYRWTTAPFNPHGSFLGDYTWLAALNGRVYGAWTQTLEQPRMNAAAKPDYFTVIMAGSADFSQGH